MIARPTGPQPKHERTFAGLDARTVHTVHANRHRLGERGELGVEPVGHFDEHGRREDHALGVAAHHVVRVHDRPHHGRAAEQDRDRRDDRVGRERVGARARPRAPWPRTRGPSTRPSRGRRTGWPARPSSPCPSSPRRASSSTRRAWRSAGRNHRCHRHRPRRGPRPPPVPDRARRRGRRSNRLSEQLHASLTPSSRLLFPARGIWIAFIIAWPARPNSSPRFGGGPVVRRASAH